MMGNTLGKYKSRRLDYEEIDYGPDGIFEDAVGGDIYGPEEGLKSGNLAKCCKKNPGHKKFIPIKKFQKKHLPQHCPNKDEYFDYLKSLADLVVKIVATKVSTERPIGTSHYENRGKIAFRHCSGFVTFAVLCGQSDTGTVVEADLIQDFLGRCKLSEPDRWPVEVQWFDFKENTALNHAERCVGLWKEENVDRSPQDQHCDHFTKDLLLEIESCKKKASNEAEDDNERNSRGLITLNDFRKSRGLSVSEFCAAVSRGLAEDGNCMKMVRFWSDFGPLLETPCQCYDCLQSPTPQKAWWAVKVNTATHAVYDHQEAEGATVSLFYDDNEAQAVTMHGISRSSMGAIPASHDNVHPDRFRFICSLHDVAVGKQLQMHMQRIREGYSLSSVGPSKCYPAAVIGHPHGAIKHISFGKQLKSQEAATSVYSSAPTCPGSSGGPVIRRYNIPTRYLQLHSRAIGRESGRSGECLAHPRNWPVNL